MNHEGHLSGGIVLFSAVTLNYIKIVTFETPVHFATYFMRAVI